MKQFSILAILLASILISSCDSITGQKDDTQKKNLLLATAGLLGNQTISTIKFNVVSGSTNVSCDGIIPGTIALTTNSTLKDLRFYVHDVKLISIDGTKVDFSISTDGKWQLAAGSNNFGSYPGIALLDFEDGTNGCAGGTSETNKSITGTVPAGNYVGVEFKVGVPFYLNHLLSSSSAAPLNISAMYWAWNSGYKFAKIEFTASSTNKLFHLGSGTCSGNTAGPVNECTYPNRPTISLSKSSGAFDSTIDTITLDLNALYNGADASGSGINTCMAGNTNATCQPIIANIGVTPTSGVPSLSQSAFSIK